MPAGIFSSVLRWMRCTMNQVTSSVTKAIGIAAVTSMVP